MTISGPYQEGELPALLAKYRPHVIWFPAPWPETYSFTLSAAIDAGLPIVATRIGAFPERLEGRPLTWLIPPTLDPFAWLTLFDTVADTVREWRTQRNVPMRPATAGPEMNAADMPLSRPPRRVRPGDASLVELRRDGATAVVAIPDRYDDGSFTPCAHIRLLRPLDHPASGDGMATTIADAVSVARYQADVIVTQRHAVPTIAAADALLAHTKRTGAVLIYDLDDDLLTIPADHPEAAYLTAQAAVVEHMVRRADIVRTSTEALVTRIAPLARRVQVVGNALDERIWLHDRSRRTGDYGPIRILCMGTTTHDADFAVLLPALGEIHRQFGDQIQFDLIGFVSDLQVPAWIRRLAPSPHATRSYPGFVHWVTSSGPWDIGLAPLADTPFNACKSAIKTLDYAAQSLAVLASDVAAYRGSLADGPGGRLVPNTAAMWYEALSWLIRDTVSRRRMADGAGHAFLERGTLSSQARIWREAWSRGRGKQRRAGR